MKTSRLTFSVIVIALLICGNVNGQLLQKNVKVNLYGIDYGPGIGTVSGYFTYHFTFKLNDEGMLETLHWNAKDFHLTNENGDKVKVIDTGHDTFGIIWDFFNNPAYYNEGYAIEYSEPDGWYDDIMPSEMPTDGAFINMSFKILCKGVVLKYGSMSILHVNANGDVTVEIYKSFFE